MARAGLTREAVVGQAAVLADASGLDRLTLAAVAQHFSVKLPSLYKHVRGTEDLQQELAVLALAELREALADSAIGRSGDDALRALADAYRAFAHRRPGLYAATLRAPDPDHADHLAAATAVADVVFAVLRGYGLDGDDLVDWTRILRAALHGFVALEAAGGFGLPRDVDRTFDRLVAGLVATLDAR